MTPEQRNAALAEWDAAKAELAEAEEDLADAEFHEDEEGIALALCFLADARARLNAALSVFPEVRYWPKAKYRRCS